MMMIIAANVLEVSGRYIHSCLGTVQLLWLQAEHNNQKDLNNPILSTWLPVITYWVKKGRRKREWVKRLRKRQAVVLLYHLVPSH